MRPKTARPAFSLFGKLLSLLLLLLLGGPAWAFKIPSQELQGMGVSTETLQGTLDSQGQTIALLLFIVILLVAVDIFLLATLWHSQEQVKAAVEMVKHVDLMKDAMEKILTGKAAVDTALADGLRSLEANAASANSEEEETLEIVKKGL